jgi:hypothetical protein
MFTVDTLVDNAAKQTKQTFTYIPNDDVRTSLETIVDAQAAYTKAVWTTTADLLKTAQENVVAYYTTKPVAKK